MRTDAIKSTERGGCRADVVQRQLNGSVGHRDGRAQDRGQDRQRPKEIVRDVMPQRDVEPGEEEDGYGPSDDSKVDDALTTDAPVERGEDEEGPECLRCACGGQQDADLHRVEIVATQFDGREPEDRDQSGVCECEREGPDVDKQDFRNTWRLEDLGGGKRSIRLDTAWMVALDEGLSDNEKVGVLATSARGKRAPEQILFGRAHAHLFQPDEVDECRGERQQASEHARRQIGVLCEEREVPHEERVVCQGATEEGCQEDGNVAGGSEEGESSGLGLRGADLADHRSNSSGWAE